MSNRRRIPLFQVRLEHYLLVNASNRYWDGSNWTSQKYKARHYPTLTAAQSAQRQLRRLNRIFLKSSTTTIEAVL
ncbi:hypothetical protein [Gloeothece verrucosa]|uniref:Uncharacterized protein n=1 Tax=Gloeothece verrucosa (strain PCC 7822) TaxID=497965 RepID=E0UN92_GLOV7|nr:hypothetical protein [Gloeothece verrucosa]ADN18422.1 hypothetical protein Cyan7822_6746 [Gloeothece verrucosa PCC 7822]